MHDDDSPAPAPAALPPAEAAPGRQNRGRPPKADKLSDAERARRYRARRKMLPKGSWNYSQLTMLARGEIGRLLQDAAGRPAAEGDLVTQWAYGMFLLWDRTTAQCQDPDDRDALLALFDTPGFAELQQE